MADESSEIVRRARARTRVCLALAGVSCVVFLIFLVLLHRSVQPDPLGAAARRALQRPGRRHQLRAGARQRRGLRLLATHRADACSAASREGTGALSMRSPIAIALFIIVIVSTLLITRWAARRTHSRSEFYAAGSSITGTQNGLAIAGDFMSASTILGVAGLAFTGNSDAVLYIVAPLVGFTVMLLFIAEPLRNLGRYTVPEVVALRFPGRAVRAFTAAAALVVTIFYLIAQMVGAGALIEILLGVPYSLAVVVGRDSHDAVRRVRRHARDHLGADHEGSRAGHRRAADDRPDVRPRRLRHRLAVLDRSRADGHRVHRQHGPAR